MRHDRAQTRQETACELTRPWIYVVGGPGPLYFLIQWDAGHEGIYPARMLRLACPCAACREEMTGRPLLDPARVPEDIDGVAMQLVGQYGIRIDWSDGHNTGIYTYEMLRRMCPCEKCAAERGATGR